MYWIRLGFGIVFGLACGFLRLTEYVGLTAGLAGYFLSVYLFRYVMKIGVQEVESVRSFYMIGVGSYFLSWFTIWALLYTLAAVGVL